MKSEETTYSCFLDCAYISVPHTLTPLSEISTKLDSAITLLHLHEDINQRSFHFFYYPSLNGDVSKFVYES